MAGFFDGAFSPQNFQTGILPNWLTEQLQNIPPQKLVEGFKMLTGQQDNAALPPNASPAALSAPMPQYSRNLWTPPDSNEDSPPLGSPFGPPITQGMQPMGAPMPPQQQSSGMSAMAQAPMPQAAQGGGNPLSSITGGIGGAVDGLMEMFYGGQGKRAGTAAALQKLGVDPVVAEAMARDKNLMAVASQTLLGGGSTADIKEFEYAKKQGYKGNFQDWMAAKRAGAGEYGLNPIWGTGPDGKPAFIQPGKNGSPIMPPLPQGFEIARDPIKVEGPTGTSILDPQTRQVIQFIPKDVQGAAKAHEIGQGQGQATVALPGAIQNADQALDTIKQIREHPGKQYGTGVLGIVPGIPGTQQKDFVALVDQAKGKAFLTAFESLKGSGAITEIEGRKATDAIARLDRAQTKEGFDKALTDLEDVIKLGKQRAMQKAGGNVTGAPQSPAPANDLRKKYGLE